MSAGVGRKEGARETVPHDREDRACGRRAAGYTPGVSSHPTRLVLFDVDGTLISTGGRAGKAIVRAIEQVCGVTVPIDGYRFSGKTDPLILLELLELAGLDRPDAEALLETIYDHYLGTLPEFLPPASVQVLPGVVETLDALEARRDVVVGLLTGNVAGGAEIKLRAADLWDRFAIGAFGSDNTDRNRLVPVARTRAAVRFGHDFPGTATVVVGDAPPDVRCARAGGARAVAVASGLISRQELASLGPDVVLDSLAQGGAVASLLGEPDEKPAQ